MTCREYCSFIAMLVALMLRQIMMLGSNRVVIQGNGRGEGNCPPEVQDLPR